MAKKEFTLSFLADELKDVSFVDWLVKPGDAVKEGDDLCEIVTDKVLLRTLSVPDTLADLRQNALGYGQHADFYHRADAAAAIIRGEA